MQRSAASAASPRLSASRARQSCSRTRRAGALEQLLGLRVVALAALQLRERGDRRSGLSRAGDGEILDGGLEDRLGLGPAAAPDVDVAVVRSAEADEIAAAALLGDACSAVTPLEGTLVVARCGTGHDREAQRPGTRGGVHRLTLERQQGGLVEAAHALLDLRFEHERGAAEGEPQHLEIRHAELGSDRRRPAAQLDRERPVVAVAGEIALVEVEPAVVRARIERIEQPVRPAHPAAGDADRRVEIDLVARQPGGHPCRAGGIATLAVEVIGAFARGEQRRPVVEPPGCPAEALERVGRFFDGECALERRARIGPAQSAQGFPTVGQQI